MKSPIHDITEPAEFLPEPTAFWQTWPFWLIVGLLILLILTVLYLLLKKRSPSQQRKTLLDKARKKLEKLKSEAPGLPAATTATRISLIIRRYLEEAFDDTALFETNEEFTLRPHALERLHPDSRQPVTDYLVALSELKYSPTPDCDTSPLIDKANELLAHIELNPTPDDTRHLSS